MWSAWSPNKFSFQTRLVCLLLPCKLFVYLCTPSNIKVSNVFLTNLSSFLSVPCFSFLLILYLVYLMLSCSRPNGYHLKCYQESKRVCQLMRLAPGCRLTRWTLHQRIQIQVEILYFCSTQATKSFKIRLDKNNSCVWKNQTTLSKTKTKANRLLEKSTITCKS